MAAPVGDTDPARSLAEWLRGRSDADLVRLLQRRPDLALPAPADLNTLAARLSVRTSVQRALDGLNSYRLALVHAACLMSDATDDTFTVADLAALTRPAPHSAAAAGVADLLELVVLWGEPDGLRLVGGVRDVIGPYPAGLGRPAGSLTGRVPPLLSDPGALAQALADLGDDEREVLAHLAVGPPVATLRRDGRGPGARLVARGLLLLLDSSTVELPREVGLALRRYPLGIVSAESPQIRVAARSPASLDRTGTTAVLEALRLVERLGDTWTAAPPAQLRAGGIGVRELRRTARDLGVDEPAAALVVEVAAAARLVGPTNGIEPVYLPTPEFDVWRVKPPAARWADLATAWLDMTRQPSLVHQRGDRDRLIPALGPDAERGTLPALRRTVLDALAALPPGSVPVDRADVLDRLHWSAPRRAGAQRPIAAAVLAEADLLGVTAAGGLTGYTRTLLSGSRAVAEQVLHGALPEPVDEVLVQPDLTVVVPGPPTPELAAELALLADLESTGGASVYRITESSIRRALDAGRSGDEVAAIVSRRSRTPVPQSLTYLIEDLARRHGTVRSGPAASYLRSDDEALLSRLVADRATGPLDLRRIAPTVVVSAAPVARVLDVLRQAGYAPAAEGPGGDVIALDLQPPRAASRPAARPVRSRSTGDTAAQLGELVKRLRAGETLNDMVRRNAALPSAVPGVTSASIMGTLRTAIRNGSRVLIGVAESDGTTSRHVMLPISLGGGFVRGQQTGRAGLAAFPLHRVSAVSTVHDDPDAD